MKKTNSKTMGDFASITTKGFLLTPLLLVLLSPANVRADVLPSIVTVATRTAPLGNGAPGVATLPTPAQSSLAGVSGSGEADVLQSAYGGGTAVEFERRSTFAFSAVRHRNGTVSGTLVYFFRDFDEDFQVQMEIDCVLVVGNRAKVSGLITSISANSPLPPFMSVGSRGSFQVEDNGNGGGGLPDRYSDVHFFAASCTDENDPYIPIDGNIFVSE